MKTIQQSQGALVLDQKPSRKVFWLEDILSLSTGLLLSAAGAVAVHDLVAFLTETDPSPENTALRSAEARSCLEEQLPFLKQLDLRRLHEQIKSSGQMASSLDAWVTMQAHLYGREHALYPRSRWQRIENSHKL